MMRVVYLKDHDGHKEGKEYTVEITLGQRLCEIGIAVPFSKWLEMKEAEKQAESKPASPKEEPKKEDFDTKNKFRRESKRAVSKKIEEAETAIVTD